MSAAAADPSTSSNSGETLVSAANLAVVALLKLNRVIAPVVLGWVRSRRKNWILRASKDVANDLRLKPGKRTLCVATCCLHTYQAVTDNSPELLPDPSIPSPPSPPSTPSTPSAPSVLHLSRKASLTPSTSDAPAFPSVSPVLATVGKTATKTVGPQPHRLTADLVDLHDSGGLQVFPEVSFDVEAGLPPRQSATADAHVRKADADTGHEPSARTPWPPMEKNARSLFGNRVMMSDERYFRLLVLQEEHHRTIQESHWVLKSTVWTVTTVVLLILFISIVVVVVLRFREGNSRENVSFIFTLVATAIVSESDMLMAALNLKKLKSDDSGKDSSLVPDEHDGHDSHDTDHVSHHKHAKGANAKHKKDGEKQHGHTGKTNSDRYVRPLGTREHAS